MPDIILTVRQDWVDRGDAWLRKSDQPWEESGPDTRTTAEMFRIWVGRTVRNRIETYENNIINEAAKANRVDLPS